MFKTLLVAMFTLSFTLPAFAQDPYTPPRTRDTYPRGVEVYDGEHHANGRNGTGCKLRIYGEDVYDGLCNVSRGIGEDRNRVTVIDTGVKKYRIVRDEFDRYTATFYSGRNEIGTVRTQEKSPCWTGPDVRFCAN